jgi:hypothetical protein
VIGEAGGDAEQMRIIKLDGTTGERRVAAAEILADPTRFFPETGSRR